jgi:hypothetical protein
MAGVNWGDQWRWPRTSFATRRERCTSQLETELTAPPEGSARPERDSCVWREIASLKQDRPFHCDQSRRYASFIDRDSSVATTGWTVYGLMCEHAPSRGAGIIFSEQKREEEHDTRGNSQHPECIDVG